MNDYKSEIPEDFFGSLPIGTTHADIRGAFGESARTMLEANCEPLGNFAESGRINIEAILFVGFVPSMQFLRTQAKQTSLSRLEEGGQYAAQMSGDDWRIELDIRL